MATLNKIREQADAALSAGDHKKATSLALLIQRHFPKDYQTLELIGKLYLENRRLQESRDAFARSLEIDPENVLARSALAMIAEEEGDLDEALEQFERALDVAPGNHEVAAEVERLRAQLGRGKSPEPGSSMHATARRFLAVNRYENAIPWLQEVLRQSPDLTDVAMGLIRALWLARRQREAEDLARELIVQHPDCLGALAVVAAMALSREDGEAVSLLARTSELDPGNAVTKKVFAEAGIVFPELEEMLDIPENELQETLKPDIDASPDGAIAQATSTNDEEREGQEVVSSEADREESDAATPDEEQPAARHMASAARHAANGEVELALAEYRAAVRLDPTVARTIGEAALALIETAPDGAQAHWLAGDAMALDGQFTKAVEQYLLVLKGAMETHASNPEGVR